jgi:hypothetical protein
MRQGQQNRRGRGRGGSSNNNSNNNSSSHNISNNNRKGQNPLSRSYESSGPDVKIRGTAAQIAEKYTALARDASSAGDTIMAENYQQHAEHYNRIILAAQAQVPQPVHNGSDAGHPLNGAHRGHREGNGAMRDQPQPHINGEAMDVQPQPQPQPRLQPVAAEQPVREQPVPNEQPVIEGDMFTEAKHVPAAPAEAPSAEGDPVRRRRRRYPTGAAAAGGEVGAPAVEKPSKAKPAAPSEEQPSDEATA